MTSSLVGSEMCIRDSHTPDQREPRSARPTPATPPALNGGQASSSTTLATVSYTHLTLPTICSV
eukprot:7247947-Prorocentrum_lima.AAC.1